MRIYVVLVGLFMTSCNKLDEGMVLYKIRIPSYDHIVVEYDAALKLPLPRVKHEPDQYIIWVQGISHQGDTLVEEYHLRESTFKELHIGDSLDLNELHIGDSLDLNEL